MKFNGIFFCNYSYEDNGSQSINMIENLTYHECYQATTDCIHIGGFSFANIGPLKITMADRANTVENTLDDILH